MKSQSYFDVPEEELSSTQFMYQQLQKTTQKWFPLSKKHSSITQNRPSNSITQSSTFSHHFDKKQSNLTSRPQISNQSSDSNYCSTLSTLMKEQIQICNLIYTRKMKSLIQQQGKQIMQLQNLLSANEKAIKEHSNTISSIAQIVFDKSRSISQQKIQFTDLLAANTKIKKLSAVIKGVQNVLEQSSLKKQNRKNQQSISIPSKDQKAANLTYISHSVKNLSLKIQNLEEAVEKFNSTVDQCQKESLKTRFEEMQGQFDYCKEQIEVLKNKKYQYENFTITQLSQLLQKLKSQTSLVSQALSKNNSLEQRNPSKTKYSHHTDIKNTIEKRVKPRNHTRGESTTTISYEQDPLIKSQTKKIVASNSLKDKTLMKKEWSSTTVLKQRFEGHSSQSEQESDVEATILIEDQDNIVRFLKLFAAVKRKGPIQIEVDQTGYAKSLDSGMYLVDQRGDGFEFSSQQLAYLSSKKIIDIR